MKVDICIHKIILYPKIPPVQHLLPKNEISRKDGKHIFGKKTVLTKKNLNIIIKTNKNLISVRI